MLDMESAINGGPWSFDGHLLVIERMKLGVQLENIPLYSVDFWIQVHNLPAGLMLERVGKTIANFIGDFVEYDKNNNSSFWRQYMRLRVKIDVRKPLKKHTRVKNKGGEWCTVLFKYEKLGLLCFVCGILGHSEQKCEVRFAMPKDNGVRMWSSDIRAELRRGGGGPGSRWFKKDSGRSSSSMASMEENKAREPQNAGLESDILLQVEDPLSLSAHGEINSVPQVDQENNNQSLAHHESIFPFNAEGTSSDFAIKNAFKFPTVSIFHGHTSPTNPLLGHYYHAESTNSMVSLNPPLKEHTVGPYVELSLKPCDSLETKRVTRATVSNVPTVPIIFASETVTTTSGNSLNHADTIKTKTIKYAEPNINNMPTSLNPKGHRFKPKTTPLNKP